LEFDSTPQARKEMHRKRKRIYEFVVDDDTLIKVGNELVWVWVAIELKAKTILGICVSYERSMLLQNNLYNH
jgi:transposase-like protein